MQAGNAERQAAEEVGFEREHAAGAEDASLSARSGKWLLRATRPFTTESRLRSWWCVLSTLTLLIAALVAAAVAPWWPLRIVASVLGGLLMVRSFILYHDFMHGAILRRSRAAKLLFSAFGLVALTPPRSWRYSHNFHHAHVGNVVWSDVGSFRVMTTDMWHQASTLQRLWYRVTRHPVTILCGYLTVFFTSICLMPLLKRPRTHWDSALSLLVHGGIIAGLWMYGGLAVACLSFALPFAIAAALGGYLFYAQHNFETARGLAPEEWNYYRGALESSSFLKLGPLMNWFTGNIGYHHVHHMNPLIPFYRLPEAMATIPELQAPLVTTLHPRDVWACFRLGLWDPKRQRMVSYREASMAA